MGRRKAPEPSASSSSLSLPGQGDGEYSPRLKANLIRSRTRGPAECRSPYSRPSLGSCLVTALGGACGSDSASLSLTVSLSFSH